MPVLIQKPGRRQHSLTRRWIGPMLILLGLLSLPTASYSHAQMERSNPGPRAMLSRPPQRIQLWFNEKLEQAYSTIVVENSAGTSVTEQKASVDGENQKQLTLELPLLEPGKYIVRYKVLSVDGHVVDSKFKFKVKATPSQ